MARQLTPEEIAIIRNTEREGAEAAARNGEQPTKGRLLRNALILAGIIFLFILTGWVVMYATL